MARRLNFTSLRNLWFSTFSSFPYHNHFSMRTHYFCAHSYCQIHLYFPFYLHQYLYLFQEFLFIKICIKLMGNLQVLPTIIEKVTPLVKTLVKWIQNKNAQNDIQQLIDNGQQETLKMLVQINQQHNANTKKLFQIMQQWQTKARTPEEFHSIHEHIEDQFVKSISTLTLPRAIQANNLKNYALFGPTSVGKTSILNAVFSLNLPVGLGACTKDIQPVTIVGQVLYWDVPGINKNFNLYKLPYLAFFNDLDKVFILFSSDIQSVSLLLKVCWVMKKQIVLVRTKCDQWLNCSKTVAQELENDLKEARRYYPSCNQVIPVGYGRYNAIKPELQ